MASQIAIKQLGTNGGGFFNANSAHPFENPAPASRTSSSCGRSSSSRSRSSSRTALMVEGQAAGPRAVRRDGRHLARDVACSRSSPRSTATRSSPRSASTRRVDRRLVGGNMEGKEVRFGPVGAGCGRRRRPARRTARSTRMHDSYTPIGGMVPMLAHEARRGQPGRRRRRPDGHARSTRCSRCSSPGLMVGRTPEYLGKKIQAAEMKLVVLYILAMPLALLGVPRRVGVRRLGARHDDLEPRAARLHGDALQLRVGRQQQRLGVRRHHRRHAVDNTTLGLAMLIGRFFLIIPALAIARFARPQAAGPGDRGHVPDRHAAVRRARHRRRSSSSPASRSSPRSRSARSSSTCSL